MSLTTNTESVRNRSPLKWKNNIIPEYFITPEGNVFYNDTLLSKWQINNRNYVAIYVNGKKCQYRVDYMVAYTFKTFYDDAIRLIHIDEDISNDKVDNLMWYRRSDVMKEYINLAIIESDGTIEEKWAPCYLEYNSTLKLEVSNTGLVRDAITKEPKQLLDSHGYLVFYYLDENTKATRIKSLHRAVAEAFIENPNKFDIVNHLDGDRRNCAVWNLEWATIGMNTEHAYIQGFNRKDRYTDNQIHAVCDLLSRRNISHIEIFHMTGVNRKTISDILHGRRWKDISSKYTFPKKRWSKELQMKIIELVNQGLKGQEVLNRLNLGTDQAAISFYERTRRDYKHLITV
jgi:hypothetical protein